MFLISLKKGVGWGLGLGAGLLVSFILYDQCYLSHKKAAQVNAEREQAESYAQKMADAMRIKQSNLQRKYELESTISAKIVDKGIEADRLRIQVLLVNQSVREVPKLNWYAQLYVDGRLIDECFNKNPVI